MNTVLTTYFDGEKNAAVILIALGILGLAAAALFWPPRWGLRTFAVTLIVFAAIEIAIGVGLYVRTAPQVARLLAQLGSDGAGFFAAEAARMARVQHTFMIVQYVEAALIILAALTVLVQKQRVGLSGIAFGVLLHAGVLLVFDTVAERRGAVYWAALQAGSGPSPSR